MVNLIFTNLRYLFLGNERGMFTMNPNTGDLQQHESVLENGFTGAEIRLVIQVGSLSDAYIVYTFIVCLQNKRFNRKNI